MEKKIVGISALCFGLIAVIALAGALIDDLTVRRIVVIGGCIIVVLLTFLNFKYLKEMRRRTAEAVAAPEPENLSMDELARWLQGATWAEILSQFRLESHYPQELASFRAKCAASAEATEPANIKGFRIWRSEENEKYFDEASGNAESILVLMEMQEAYIEVHHSNALYQELMMKLK